MTEIDYTLWKYSGIPKEFITERRAHHDRRVLRSMWLKMLKKKHKYLLKDWKYNEYYNKWEFDFYAEIEWDPIPKVRKSSAYKTQVKKRRKLEEDRVKKEKADRLKIKDKKKRKKRNYIKKREEIRIAQWQKKLDEIYLKSKGGLDKEKTERISNVRTTIEVKYRFKAVNSIVQDAEGTYWRIPFKLKGKIYGAVQLQTDGTYLYNKINKTWLISDLEKTKYAKKGKINTRTLLEKLRKK